MGDEILCFMHTLKDIKVSVVESVMYNVNEKEFEKYVHMEKVTFHYVEIT